MRLIVHGVGPVGCALLDAIVERGDDEVVAVYIPPNSEATADPLEISTRELGLTVVKPSSFKDPALWTQIEAHDADLGVMAGVMTFVPEEVLNAPARGTIQLHPSLLPDHKGASPVNWPIIMGKNTTGISVYWPDNGLNAGPVLLQKSCDIGPDDTADSLFAEKLLPLGIAGMLEAIDLVRDDNAPRVAQNKGAGSHETRCGKADALIDWQRPGLDVYNLVRGCDSEPGAWTLIEGTEVTLLDCRLKAAVDASPGTLVDVSADEIVVALNGGSLGVRRIKPAGSPTLGARVWYEQTGHVRLGDVFGGTASDSQRE